MCQALGDFSMHLIFFNSYNYPAEHMFCSLTVKSLLSHAFTHLFSNYFVGAMCHALNKKLDPVLIEKDKRKRRKPSIKEIITAWDKSPGDPADWVVRKGDVWVETCRIGMGHLRALHLLCPPLAMLLLLSRRIATWGSVWAQAPLLSVWPWTSHFPSLGISFFFCKLRYWIKISKGP